jgi:hypothetical protein
MLAVLLGILLAYGVIGLAPFISATPTTSTQDPGACPWGLFLSHLMGIGDKPQESRLFWSNIGNWYPNWHLRPQGHGHVWCPELVS